MIRELDTVVLNRDIEEHKLRCGDWNHLQAVSINNQAHFLPWFDIPLFMDCAWNDHMKFGGDRYGIHFHVACFCHCHIINLTSGLTSGSGRAVAGVSF